MKYAHQLGNDGGSLLLRISFKLLNLFIIICSQVASLTVVKYLINSFLVLEVFMDFKDARMVKFPKHLHLDLVFFNELGLVFAYFFVDDLNGEDLL